MWRRPLNSTFNYYRPQKTGKVCSTGYILEYKVGWWTSGRWKWIGEDYIMGKTSIRKGSENIKEGDWRRFTVVLERTYHMKLPIHSKTYSSDVNSTSDHVRIPPRTCLEPWLTVRKPIISPILSPTLLQIYCIGLIGLISYSFWVWATICDLTYILGLFPFLFGFWKRHISISELPNSVNRLKSKIGRWVL